MAFSLSFAQYSLPLSSYLTTSVPHRYPAGIAVEIKSFINRQKHQDALDQAAEYAQQLARSEAWLITFIEVMTDEQRASLEVAYHDPITGVVVHPIFVMTG